MSSPLDIPLRNSLGWTPSEGRFIRRKLCLLSGTPTAGTGGEFAITLTASNGIGAPATQDFVLTVNESPAITSAPNESVIGNLPFSFAVVASGFPAPTFKLTGAQAWLQINTVTGVLSGTAPASAAGTQSFTISASNGIGAVATQSFMLKVVAVTACSDTWTGSAGTNDWGTAANWNSGPFQRDAVGLYPFNDLPGDGQ